MIQTYIDRLTEYGLKTGLIEPADKIYTVNRLLELFGLDAPEDDMSVGTGSEQAVESGCADEQKQDIGAELEQILAGMLDYACEKGLVPENSVAYRDLFDTKIMGLLVPRPGEVIEKFQSLYEAGPEAATDYYYKLSCDSDYIRRYRIARDKKWVTATG